MCPQRMRHWLAIAMVIVSFDMCQATPPSATAAVTSSSDHFLTTRSGTPFLVPAGWLLQQEDQLALISTPEGDGRIAIADLPEHVREPADVDPAIATIWHSIHRVPSLDETTDRPPERGWTALRSFRYDSESERMIRAQAMRGKNGWSVVLIELESSAVARREPQITRVIASMRAPGYAPLSLVGRRAKALSARDVQALLAWLERARKDLDIPGIGLGIVQAGKLRFQGGLGQRAMDSMAPVDEHTLFLTASITKPLTSLLMAKLVDEKKLQWDTPVEHALPALHLADRGLGSTLLVRHLLCACSGIPARDMDWIFSGESMTATDVLRILGETEPTAGIGELYQYSNLMAAAGGILAGHVAFPQEPLDTAYERAMHDYVFKPLRMHATSFAKPAHHTNVALPHGTTMDGRLAKVDPGFNDTGKAMKADGGAWSNVSDLLRYLRMELAHGKTRAGRYIARSVLDTRLVGQVARGGLDQWYAMGLKTDRQLGILQARHGGSMAGYQGEVFWLPEHDVGFVLLINHDAGRYLRSPFAKRLLEVLFSVDLGADKELARELTAMREGRKTYQAVMDTTLSSDIKSRLAGAYNHPGLGDVVVRHRGEQTEFDFGGWSSIMAAVRGESPPTLETVSPGVQGYRFVLTQGGSKLVLDDGTRKHTFVAR